MQSVHDSVRLALRHMRICAMRMLVIPPVCVARLVCPAHARKSKRGACHLLKVIGTCSRKSISAGSTLCMGDLMRLQRRGCSRVPPPAVALAAQVGANWSGRKLTQSDPSWACADGVGVAHALTGNPPPAASRAEKPSQPALCAVVRLDHPGEAGAIHILSAGS